MADCDAAADKPDLVLAPHLGWMGQHVAERHGARQVILRFTGYWRRQPAWTPPTALTDFLADGPTPVYVGFGSLALDHTDQMRDLIRGALRLAGARGVLQGHGDAGRDGDVYELGDAPHSWLFPRMRAVIHHGGAGTTAAALHAGVPSVVVYPAFSDQRFWGTRVAALGAGPAPIRFDDLTPGNLAAAVHAAASTTGAAEVAQRLRTESGVDRACDIIDSWQ